MHDARDGGKGWERRGVTSEHSRCGRTRLLLITTHRSCDESLVFSPQNTPTAMHLSYEVPRVVVWRFSLVRGDEFWQDSACAANFISKICEFLAGSSDSLLAGFLLGVHPAVQLPQHNAQKFLWVMEKAKGCDLYTQKVTVKGEMSKFEARFCCHETVLIR